MIRQDHLSDANRQGGVSNSGFIGEAACYFERASGNVQRTASGWWPPMCVRGGP